ncbi:MAG: hypothetical protein ABIZ92_00870 [Vicinamibacterales bacterium]
MTGLEQLPSRIDRLKLQIVQFRTEMHEGFSAVRSDVSRIETGMTTLRSDIDAARRETRVLFEEVVSRIAVLGEQRPEGASRKRPVLKKR